MWTCPRVGVWVTYPPFHLTSMLELAFVVREPKELELGSSERQIDGKEKSGQQEMNQIDAPGLHGGKTIHCQ